MDIAGAGGQWLTPRHIGIAVHREGDPPLTTRHHAPIITWLIHVYDRRVAKRFPLQRKWYRFNYARATDTEAQQVLRLCGYYDRRRDLAPDIAVGQTRFSLELGGTSGTSMEILRYRGLFDHVPDETNLHADAKDACARLRVSLPPHSYFEDESERPISLVQIFDEEAKRQYGEGATAFVIDHPESVLRHAPAEPIRPELWTPADADLIFHLFGTYTELSRSRWLQSRCVVSSVAKGDYEAVLPLPQDCMAVVLPFRQLYSKDVSDDLFNRCCKVHNRHCPPEHLTHSWIDHYQSRFNAFLAQPAHLPWIGLIKTDLSVWRYLDAFAYGARLVHATSRKIDPAADLKKLLEAYPRALVVMGYHHILQTLLECISIALPVVHRNVTHWIRDLGWANSTLTRGPDLLGAYPITPAARSVMYAQARCSIAV